MRVLYVFNPHASENQQVVQQENLTDEILTRPKAVTPVIMQLSTSSVSNTDGEITSTSTFSSDEDSSILADDSNSFPVPSVKDIDLFGGKSGVCSPLEVHLSDDEIAPAAVNFVNDIADLEIGAPVSADAHPADGNFGVDTAVEECESGYLMLPGMHQVPNCCAICLCPYEVAETVIWSNNRACKHAFHEECISEWLLKLHEGTSCPCCRQEFLPIMSSGVAPQRPVSWAPGAFDTSAISFR